MSEPSRPRSIVGLVGDGWARVAAAPAVWIGAWAISLLVTLPAAIQLQATIAADLGHSLSGATALHGVDWPWWGEFTYRHPQLESFRPQIIGFAAPLGNASAFVDREGPPLDVVAVTLVYLLSWLFLAGGILDRYARRRRVGTHAFFAACGVYFWRFLRLGVVVAAVYGALFGLLHPWLFERVYPWLTRDLAVERTAFIVRVCLYLPFLALLALAVVWFDLARARAVVEDRRSMIGALVAAGRVLRRNPGACAGAYGLNLALLLVVFAVYAAVAPGAGQTGLASLGYAVAIGEAYIAARIGVKLAFYATAVALVQDRLAHAAYTAAPVVVWPDSPSAEAITAAPPS